MEQARRKVRAHLELKGLANYEDAAATIGYGKPWLATAMTSPNPTLKTLVGLAAVAGIPVSKLLEMDL